MWQSNWSICVSGSLPTTLSWNLCRMEGWPNLTAGATEEWFYCKAWRLPLSANIPIWGPFVKVHGYHFFKNFLKKCPILVHNDIGRTGHVCYENKTICSKIIYSSLPNPEITQKHFLKGSFSKRAEEWAGGLLQLLIRTFMGCASFEKAQFYALLYSEKVVKPIVIKPMSENENEQNFSIRIFWQGQSVWLSLRCHLLDYQYSHSIIPIR